MKPGPKQIFSVMTFNLRGTHNEKTPYLAWNRRQKVAAGIISQNTPAVIGFQEARYGNLATFQDNFKNYHHFLGLNMGNGNFNPVYWDSGRFELVTGDGFWLHPSAKPNVLASEWGARTIRSTTWVILKHLETDKMLLVFNTHLDHVGEKARIEGSKLIVQKWKAIGAGLPTVVIGDFNCGTYVPPHLSFEVAYTDNSVKTFKRAGFTDVYANFHEDGPASNTFHNFEGEGYDPNRAHGVWRIDKILTCGLQFHSCEIIKIAKPPVYASDHYPVIAQLEFV